MTFMKPTFDKQSGSNYLEQCEECLIRIESGEVRYGDKPNAKLTAKEGKDTYLAYLNLKVKVIDCDVESNINKTEFVFVGLSHYDWNIPPILEQLELGAILDLFDPSRDGYVGDDISPKMDGMTDKEGWEALGNLFLTGEMVDEDNANFTFDNGMVGQEINVSFGPVKTGTDDNGNPRDQSGFINIK